LLEQTVCLNDALKLIKMEATRMDTVIYKPKHIMKEQGDHRGQYIHAFLDGEEILHEVLGRTNRLLSLIRHGPH
jgi:hypothetical protein